MNEAPLPSVPVHPVTDRPTPAPALLLHGFGQTGRCWGRLAVDLATTRPVIALDLPGHGGAAAVTADLWTTADLVADSIDPGNPAVLVGYSMGGRVALHTALAHPERVRRLVLISTTAGIDDDAEREARRNADAALADRIEAIGVDTFVDEWLGQALFAGLTDGTRFADERRANSAAGLAASLRLAGTGTQEPLWSRVGDLEMPVLVIAGDADPKFRALGERLVTAIGANATFAVVGGAGHSAHLEQAELTTDLVATWLDTPLDHAP